VSTEPLPSNDRRDTHTDTLMGGIYKYTGEMGSAAMIYIQSFIMTDSGIRKLMLGINRHTDSMVIA
jgi:hypothetical protein